MNPVRKTFNEHVAALTKKHVAVMIESASTQIQHLSSITHKFPPELRDSRSTGIDIAMEIRRAKLLNHISHALIPLLELALRVDRGIMRPEHLKQFGVVGQ